MSIAYLENTSRFIPAHWHPGIFIDFVCQQGIDANRLLRGSGLFLADITEKNTSISIKQFSQIMTNAKTVLPEQDWPLKFGSRIFPGNFEPLSAALAYAENLMEAMQLLAAWPLLAFPLLKAQLVENEHELGIEWQDVFGLADLRQESVELAFSGWLSFSKWQSGLDLPWRFEFDFSRPAQLECYEVFLADKVNIHTGQQALLFNRAACRMWIPRENLFQSWRFASATACHHAKNELVRKRSGIVGTGLCGAVAELIEANLAKGLQLQDAAEALNMSASTLKRRLKAHNSSFQLLLDEVRRKKSVDLILRHKLPQEKIALSLGIQDAANFRRSFKRWTGVSPGEYAHTYL